ncbi:hypothetical protein Tco_1255944 [Tanacetum coccineum]
MSSGLSAGMTEVATMFESAFRKRFRSSYESSPSGSPPDLSLRKHYHGMSELVEDSDDEEDEEIEKSMDSDSMSEDAKDEGPTAEDEDPAVEDEGLTVGVEGPGMVDEGYGLDDESRGIDDEGYSIESDGLGLEEEEEAVPGALRRRELALEEGDVYSTFEVGQGSEPAPESKIPKRVSAFRQPTLTTWTDPEDGMIYIDIPDYPPPAPPIQTPPSPEWTYGSLPISPSHSDAITYFIAYGGFISDNAVRLEELSPALFKRSLEYEQERVAVTFGAIWRPVLALEAWAGENHDLRLQLAEERRARLELAEIIDGMRRGRSPESLRAQFCPCASALRLVARGRADTHTFIRWWRAMYLVYSVSLKCIRAGRFYHLLGDIVGRFWNGLPRMGRAEMVDQARFAWGFLSVFGNANSDRFVITSRTGSYPDTRLRQ